MIPWRKATPPTVDNFFLQFDDSFPPLFVTHQLQKEHTKLNPVSSFSLYSHTSQHTQSPPSYPTTSSYPLNSNMPGPDPRKTKPSAYTIPKAGSSKPVGTRPPLHAAGAKDDNPRPLTHQEVRRGKSIKQPAVSRTSARLATNRRSPAQRSRVASLKRPDKYDPKSSINLTQLGSKAATLAARQAPPTIPRHTDSPGPALTLSDSDDDVLLLNDFDGEENDESIEAIKEAIDQMGVDQPEDEFEMAAQSGSEYAYLLAGNAEEKKRAEALIQQVLNSNSYSNTFHLHYLFLSHSAN